MPKSDNNTRTPMTPKRAAAAGETPARKRTTKKTAEAAGLAAASKAPMAAPLAAAPRSAERVPPAAGMTTASAATATPASETVRSMAVATGARPDPVIAKVVDADERRRMIAEAAYHKFLQRGPGNGSPAQDWIEAEAEIDALLAEQYIVRAQ